ncbi:hypothetical protein ABZ141_15525 [Klebsiella pneumoniae]
MSSTSQKKYIQDYIAETKAILDEYKEPSQFYNKFSRDLKTLSDDDRESLFEQLFSDIRNERVEGKNHIHDSNTALHYAFFALEAAGCTEWAKRVTKIIPIISSMNDAGEAYARMRIREEKAKAGKGKVSRHKETAVQIAVATWEKYPNASLPGMRDELYAYLRGKWKDCPASSTIQGWLQELELNPVNNGVKNRDFSLVIL